MKNQFFYPGFTLGGPLVMPGGMNKSRDKLFFFVGYEYFKQRLDTGFIKSWVPTDAMRNGDFSNPSAVGSGSFVNTPLRGFANGQIPGSQIDPGGRALMNLFPLPNADPAVTGGYNYVDNLLVDQNGYQLLGARRRQHQRQHQAVRPLQPAARDAAVRDRPVVAQRRAPAAVSVADRSAQPVRLGRPRA